MTYEVLGKVVVGIILGLTTNGIFRIFTGGIFYYLL